MRSCLELCAGGVMRRRTPLLVGHGVRPLVGAISGEPPSTDIRPHAAYGAFGSLALPGIQTQLATSADAKNLVRIERVSRWT
jgi:hypothetical protein